MIFLNTIECPFCLENIRKGAFICKYCKREIDPDLIPFYREVLETNPELRKNTESIKQKLQSEVNLFHKKYLSEVNRRAKTKLQEDEELSRQQKEIEKIRKKKIELFKKSNKYRYFIKPFSIISGVSLLFFLIVIQNLQSYKDYIFISKGGMFVNLDSFIKAELKELNKENLGVKDKLTLETDSTYDYCVVRINPNKFSSSCFGSGWPIYTDSKNEKVFVSFDFLHCEENKEKIKSVIISSILIPVQGEENMSTFADQKYLSSTKKWLYFQCN